MSVWYSLLHKHWLHYQLIRHDISRDGAWLPPFSEPYKSCLRHAFGWTRRAENGDQWLLQEITVCLLLAGAFTRSYYCHTHGMLWHLRFEIPIYVEGMEVNMGQRHSSSAFCKVLPSCISIYKTYFEIITLNPCNNYTQNDLSLLCKVRHGHHWTYSLQNQNMTLFTYFRAL